jgi:hypothetical protein
MPLRRAQETEGATMSGGRWDYRQETLGDHVIELLDAVAVDPDVAARFPRLVRVLKARSTTLHDELQAMQGVLHDLDWDLSGDRLIKDDRAFENDVIDRLTAGMAEKPVCPDDGTCSDKFCPFLHETVV